MQPTLGTPIESLPLEILHEIINYALLPRKKEKVLDLCLVSRRFSDIACPILFSHICLGGFTSFHRKLSSQLKELSKGDTKASALAKHLSIDYSSCFPDDPARVLSPLEKVMLKHLKSAIRSFRSITTMSWNLGSYYHPSWVIDSIIYELAGIPTLRDISLNYLQYLSHIGNLDAFSNLHKIRVQVIACPSKVICELGKLLVQCPGLTDLDISLDIEDDMSQLFQFLDQTGKSLSLRHLKMERVTGSPDFFKLAIGNLRSLQSLHIHRSLPNDMVSGVTFWDILREERIYIQNLSTDAADDSLLRYLTSFHGLRKFSIIGYSRASLQFDHITVLQTMIPHHAKSLTELSMVTGSESQISDLTLSENLINLLSSVENLKYFGLQLHIASYYISIIASIIQTCTKIFPKLQLLVLHMPRMAWYPLNTISPPDAVHDAITRYQLDELSVASFFEIECGGRVYFLRQDETTGTFSYFT